METPEFNPPYLPFKTLTNLFDRLAENGIPNRIDRTFLNHLAGITQTYLLAALRTFELIDGDDRPTDKLKAFATDRAQRPALMAELVRTYYADAIALGEGATPGELDEVFNKTYGLQGDTRRKGITFFLNAASYGEVPLSNHYKLPRARSTSASSNGGSAGSGTTPRRKRSSTRRRTPPGDQNTPPTPSTDSLRTRYIDMLMKKAEAQDEFDADLLDRIETLLGFEGQPDEDEQED